MAWCRQATSHYLRQGWPRSMSPYGVTRPQWVTLTMRVTDYSVQTTSISLLMPWLIVLPGHHIDWARQVCPCLWWEKISTTCTFPMWRNAIKCSLHIYVSSKKIQQVKLWWWEAFLLPFVVHLILWISPLDILPIGCYFRQASLTLSCWIYLYETLTHWPLGDMVVMVK